MKLEHPTEREARRGTQLVKSKLNHQSQLTPWPSGARGPALVNKTTRLRQEGCTASEVENFNDNFMGKERRVESDLPHVCGILYALSQQKQNMKNKSKSKSSFLIL